MNCLSKKHANTGIRRDKNMIVSNENQITLDWLRSVLSSSSANVSITAFKLVMQRSITSKMVFLHIDRHASLNVPEQLLLKIGGTRYEAGSAAREVDFYQRIATQIKEPALIPCHFALTDHELGISNIILSDLQETHAPPPDALPLGFDWATKCVQSLANLHAAFWNNTRHLDSADPVTNQIIARVEWDYPRFHQLFGGLLSTRRRAIFEQVFANFPRLYEKRLNSNLSLTLVHGDIHPWNFMFPHQSGGPLYLIDWPAWHVGLATTDLAHFIGLVGYRDYRQQFEKHFLDIYQAVLRDKGCAFTQAQFFHDYRISLMRNLYWVIFLWSTGNLPAAIWWSVLEKAFTAFDDWKCIDLIGE